MKEFTILVKQFTTKDGARKFTTASVQGKFLPEGTKCDPETWYKLKPVQMMVPAEEGKYKVQCENVWVDNRAEYTDKSIVRCKGNICFIKQ